MERRREFDQMGGATTDRDGAPSLLPKQRDLSAAARRALAEAAERRRALTSINLPDEVGGRNGSEPVRFGDWEVNGLATDF